jgi:hypothetical protein
MLLEFLETLSKHIVFQTCLIIIIFCFVYLIICHILESRKIFMRIIDNNGHGNKDWVKRNKCAHCTHKQNDMAKDHCNIITNKPKQKCPFFKEK